MIDLSGRSAVVTGSGRGIGEAIARWLAKAGAAVAVTDINIDLAQKTAQAISAGGAKAIALQVNVSDPESVAAMARQAADRLGHIDTLVNNAGVQSYVGFEDTTLEEWNRVMSINLTGMFVCTQAVLPHMRSAGGGAIVNLASMAARTGGQASPVAYATSKTGVLGITRSTARSLGQYGIRVNAICPGIIDTEMIAHWDQATRERWEAQMPLRRLGTIDDVAKVVVFLVSDLAAYVTGTTTDINGGYAMY